MLVRALVVGEDSRVDYQAGAVVRFGYHILVQDASDHRHRRRFTHGHMPLPVVVLTGVFGVTESVKILLD